MKRDIKNIPLCLLDDFPEHPYKINDDNAMQKLLESITKNGVIVPAVVRPKGNRFEIISGHRRKRACELAGLSALRCEVVDITRDEAIILMVESNCQREETLPSEKAFAYKMQLDALKRQNRQSEFGMSPIELYANYNVMDLNTSPSDKILNSGKLLAKNANVSRNQIYRYIRLTCLIPELLTLVDEEKMKMRPAVEISYLSKDMQTILFDAICENENTPSHAQTIRIRKMYDEGVLNRDKIFEIMKEDKPNQKERIIISNSDIEKYIPKNISIDKKREYVYKALEHYRKFLKNERFHNAR